MSYTGNCIDPYTIQATIIAYEAKIQIVRGGSFFLFVILAARFTPFFNPLLERV